MALVTSTSFSEKLLKISKKPSPPSAITSGSISIFLYLPIFS